MEQYDVPHGAFGYVWDFFSFVATMIGKTYHGQGCLKQSCPKRIFSFFPQSIVFPLRKDKPLLLTL